MSGSWVGEKLLLSLPFLFGPTGWHLTLWLSTRVQELTTPVQIPLCRLLAV